MPIRVGNTGWTVCDRSNQEDTRKGRCKTFGNYFLIKENNKGVWKKTKIKGSMIEHIYSANGDFRSNQILEDVNTHRVVSDWTSESINDRNQLLVKAFEETWKI